MVADVILLHGLVYIDNIVLKVSVEKSESRKHNRI